MCTGLNGVCPVTSKKIIDIFIIPYVMYGLACLPLTSEQQQPMERYYKEPLKGAVSHTVHGKSGSLPATWCTTDKGNCTHQDPHFI